MSNLLPKKEKSSILSLYRKRFLSLVFWGVAALAVISIIMLFPSLYVLTVEGRTLTDKRDALAGHETTQVSTSLAASISDINTRLSVFPDTVVSSPIIAALIDPVLKLKTNAIHITSFTFTKGATNAPAAIQISGTTDSRADLLDFAEEMKKTGKFGNVNVPIASFIKNSNATFTITASVLLPK